MFQVQGPDGIEYHENMTVDRTLELIEALKSCRAGGEVMAHILLRHREIPDIDKLDVYRKNGGFEAFKKAVTQMKPADVTDVVKNSGLRGRGGAGFPTGMKWSFIDNKNWPHYVVANADESEPGTFKDREIMEGNPFQFLEGVAIASYAVGANVAYVYLRGEFWQMAASAGCEDRRDGKGRPAGRKAVRRRLFACEFTPIWARALTSAAKRPPCSNRSKANGASRACARHSRPPSGCTASRPSSTMWRR